jgi:cyclic-di-AMP phosphodiesterase PgpH
VLGRKQTGQPLALSNKHLIILLCCLLLTTIVHVKIPYYVPDYHVGDVASYTLRAPRDVVRADLGENLKKGDVILRAGQKIEPADLQKLAAVKTGDKSATPITERFLFLFIILLASIVIVYHFAEKNMKRFALSDKDLIFCLSLTLAWVLAVKLFMVGFEQFLPDHAQDLFYAVPLFAFGMILRIIFFPEAALIFSTILGAAVAFTLGNGLSVFLYVFLGNILAAYFTGRCEKRSVVIKAGLYVSAIMSFLMVMFHSLVGHPVSDLPIRICAIFFAGISGSFITLGLLPIIEYVFDYATDIRLLEMANLEHPLLGEMMLNAPGTYHHSIVVGNLSKAAAESVGAHPILTRVAAYYHDVGKLKMPHYYIENRAASEDAHDGLSPHMSAMIILSHVKEGVELAERFRLGSKIQEMIRQHHGTTLVNQFYSRAKEMEDLKAYALQEADFRYLGPKPQTKEAGILMLADAVEAASRRLEESTPKRIETLVQSVVETIFVDGQLDECELTMKDLHAIQRSFVTVLLGIFHHRIDYPERMENGGFDKRFPKIVRPGPAKGKKSDRRLIKLFGSRE